jgi:Bacterial regulatory proteins, luxR family
VRSRPRLDPLRSCCLQQEASSRRPLRLLRQRAGGGKRRSWVSRAHTRAAAGAANRDIAQTLFVTPKSVELHLSDMYRKVGIRSRLELPPALG